MPPLQPSVHYCAAPCSASMPQVMAVAALTSNCGSLVKLYGLLPASSAKQVLHVCDSQGIGAALGGGNM